MANANANANANEKFRVYQNPAIASALLARSVKPSPSQFAVIIALWACCAVAFILAMVQEARVMELIASLSILRFFAHELVKVVQILSGLIFVAATMALCKAIYLKKWAESVLCTTKNSPGPKRSKTPLTEYQQELLGLNKNNGFQPAYMGGPDLGIKQRPGKQTSSAYKRALVPVHHYSMEYMQWPPEFERHDTTGFGIRSATTAEVCSPSQTKQESDQKVPSPWSKYGSGITKNNIDSEEKLEQFLADVEEKLTEPAKKKMKAAAAAQGSATGTRTSPGIQGAFTNNPPSMSSRTTPIRTVRISRTQQKYHTPPKRGEGDLPPPMSMEQSIEAFKNLGVYPHIEHWRDKLRQWFSEALLKPLVQKIDTSHLQVMQAAAKLGLTVNVTKVGSNEPSPMGPVSALSNISGNEWRTTYTLDEDGVLHQLRAVLVQARDAPNPQPSLLGLHPPKDLSLNPLIQECIDAVTEHQRLRALMKGEWVNGLLPQKTVRPDYTVQRVRELAEGTCVKNFEYDIFGEAYDKSSNRWYPELPTDSHLLLYLFCALLEHPQWMLHADSAAYPSAHSGKNPLFVNMLPPTERFPEKYAAVLSCPPNTLHAGACVLVVGKQSPPILALYWDSKLQFSLQGRTALWDAILLLCHRIEVAHGGVVRGISLASSAFNILSIFEEQDQGSLNQAFEDGFWLCF